MKNLVILSVFVFFTLTSFAWKTTVTVSEPEAEIFVNGTKVGYSPQEIKIGNKECVQVEVRKVGFLPEKRTYCIGLDKKGHPEAPKKELIVLKKDEAYEASASSDVANNDIELVSSKSEDQTWKVISEVITSYFDVLEVTDKSTGYIRTSWVTQSFNGKTIRTRIIIKGSSSGSVVKYKIKIQSEVAEGAGMPVKEDEKFQPWERVLKKYSGLIPELQNRLK